jgi:hypothetical protein
MRPGTVVNGALVYKIHSDKLTRKLEAEIFAQPKRTILGLFYV